jgi:hypothetical protein
MATRLGKQRRGTARNTRRHLAYPVLIQLQDNTPSGFFLNAATSMHLATAKHVLFNLQSGRLLGSQMILLSHPRDPKESGRNIISADLAVVSQKKKLLHILMRTLQSLESQNS